MRINEELLNQEIIWYDKDKALDFSNFIKNKKFNNQIKKKIYVIRNYTCEPIFDLVSSQFKFSNYSLDLKFGKFDGLLKDLSEVDRDKEYDAIIISVDYFRFLRIEEINSKNLDNFEKFLKLFKVNLIQASQSLLKPIIIQSVCIEKKQTLIQKKYVSKIYKFLKEISKITNIQICEELTLKKIYDKRNWDIAGLPYNHESLKIIASNFSKKLYENIAKPIKVIATDLDNTFWSGVAGDEKIKLKTKKVNFEEYHKALINLKKKGYLLTIVSKNNINTVKDIFKINKFKFLKLSDFILIKANWKPKSENLKDIAKELNVGEDSIVFIDDSKHERFEVLKNANKIRVFPFVEKKFINIVKQFPEFQKSVNLAEDKKKTKMYLDQFKRTKAKSKTKNFNEYLKLLDQKIKLRKDSISTLDRSAQMETKINQFNMTLERYNYNEVRKFIKDENKTSYLFKVEDKFGDNGYVCSVLTERINNNCYLRSFLMSCRVIERDVEYNILNFVIKDQFKKYKVEKIISKVKKGDRNSDFILFYEKFGFIKINYDSYIFKKNTTIRKFNKIKIIL